MCEVALIRLLVNFSAETNSIGNNGLIYQIDERMKKLQIKHNILGKADL
jgi:hypothetical protein